MKIRLPLLIFFILSIFFIFRLEALAQEAKLLRIFNISDFSLEQEFPIFDENFKEVLSLSTIDLGGDGIKEILVGAGPGQKPEVRIYRSDGSLVRSFLAYQEDFWGGVNVTAADLDGDGYDEIITGPGQSGGPHIRVFDGFGRPKITLGFFAFSEKLRSGAGVASADIDGDGKDEIIATSGPGQPPAVKIFKANTQEIPIDFSLSEFSQRGGIRAQSVDLGGDGTQEILISGGFDNPGRVKIFRGDSTSITEFLGYPEVFQGGLNLASADLDGDGRDEIITGPGMTGGPQVRALDGFGQAKFTPGFFAYEESFRGGVKVAAGDVDADDQIEIITLPERNTPQGKTDYYKYIEVDLSKQKLYAYQNGYLVNSYYISSGISRFPTPEGTFTIFKKRRKVRMSWYYGPESPFNYDLPGVPDVLSFKGPFTIHGAYWHNNFGRPMSHGCVNEPLEEARWLYEWAPMGTVVIIHK